MGSCSSRNVEVDIPRVTPRGDTSFNGTPEDRRTETPMIRSPGSQSQRQTSVRKPSEGITLPHGNKTVLPCDVCSENGRLKRAVVECLHCNEFLCEKCQRAHKMVKMTKDHHLVVLQELYSDALTEEMTSVKAVSCPIHHSEQLEFFCVQDNVPICAKCPIIEHRYHECISLSDAVKVSRVKLGELARKTVEELETVEDTISSMKTSMDNVTDNSKAIKNQIEQHTDRLISAIRAEADNKLSDVDVHVKKQQKSVDPVKSEFNDRKVCLQSAKDSLKSLKNSNDGEMLLQVGQEEKSIKSLLKQELVPIKPQVYLLQYAVKPPNDLDLSTLSGTCKAHVEYIRPANAVLIWEHQISLDEGQHLYSVEHTGDNILVGIRFKHQNKETRKIVILDKEGREQGKLIRPNMKGFAVLPDGNIAVSYGSDSCVQFYAKDGQLIEELPGVKGDRMTVNKDNQLVICNPGSSGVSIYSLDGRKVYEIDDKTEYKFEYTRHIITNNTTGDIIVSDPNDHQIRAYNSVYKQKFRHSFTYGSMGTGQSQFDVPQGLCAHPLMGDLYICDLRNHRIHVTSSEGHFKYFLLTKDEGIKLPKDISFSPDGNLVIVQYDGKVKVYTGVV